GLFASSASRYRPTIRAWLRPSASASLCVSDIGRFLDLVAMINLAKSGAAHFRKIGGRHLRALPRRQSHPERAIRGQSVPDACPMRREVLTSLGRDGPAAAPPARDDRRGAGRGG